MISLYESGINGILADEMVCHTYCLCVSCVPCFFEKTVRGFGFQCRPIFSSPDPKAHKVSL